MSSARGGLTIAGIRPHLEPVRSGARVHRILVIDDEESICFSMREYFTLQGFQVVCAREKYEAEKFLTAGEYSVLIEDLRLDGIYGAEGFEIIRDVKARHP